MQNKFLKQTIIDIKIRCNQLITIKFTRTILKAKLI